MMYEMLQHLIPCVQPFQTSSGKSRESTFNYGPTLVHELPKPVKKLLDLGADLWNEVRRRVGDHSAKVKLTLDVQKWLLVY